MRTIHIDCAGVKSVAEFWQRYLDAVRPGGADLFGRNLDAFWDAIERGGPGWPGETKLVFEHSSELGRFVFGKDGSLLDGLRRVAADATRTRIDLD